MSSLGREGARANIAASSAASPAEVAAWTTVVLISSLVPGLGVLIAAVLAFTRLRHSSNARWVLIGVSVAVTVVGGIIGVQATGSGEIYEGPAQPVR